MVAQPASGNESIHDGMHHEGMDHDGAHHEDGPREACPYGVVGFTAALPDSPVAIAALPYDGSKIVLPTVRRVAATPHAPRPPTRGPPTIA